MPSDFFSYRPAPVDRQPSLSPKSFAPAVFWDHSAYPHLTETVLNQASWDVRLALRGTCRAFKQKVDALQTKQLIFFLGAPPPDAIRSPCGRVPALRSVHGDDAQVPEGLFDGTGVVDVIGSPADHLYSEHALKSVFSKRDTVLRFHRTNHLHDIAVPVAARHVVLFGASLQTVWPELPPPERTQEKTIINLRGLNKPDRLVSAFRRFPPASGKREAAVVLTHWGTEMGYSVPMAINDLVNPLRLRRERLATLVELAAGMVLGGWLFPEMPPVKFSIVDFDQVSPQQWALDRDDGNEDGAEQDEENQGSGSGTGSATGVGSLSGALGLRIRNRVAEMVEKRSPSAALSKKQVDITNALQNLHIVTLAEYAAALGDEHEFELDTVQLRYGSH